MSITVILNCYRRPDNIKEQIEAIKKQSVQPTEIWVWINDHIDNHGYSFSDLVDVEVRSSRNFMFHSRFALGLLATTEFVAFFDDDTIPGENWFMNCLETMKTHSGILGGAGVLLRDRVYDIPGYPPMHDRMGWPTQNKEVERVDLVGHAWFLKRSDLNYLWSEIHPTMENCEDMQLSFLAQKHGGVQTYCPPHPSGDKSLWSSLRAVELGDDKVASSNARKAEYVKFANLRNAYVNYAIDNGWDTVREIK
jgi:hypothetical protein